MNHYEGHDILNLCSGSVMRINDLARKIGIRQETIERARHKAETMADLASKALRTRYLYTLVLTKLVRDNALEHEYLLTTPHAFEAFQLRNDLNRENLFYGSRRAAQVIRREIMPRQWKLWVQTSAGEIYLRCQWTQARALLRRPTAAIMEQLYGGHVLPHGALIFLQSERVEFSMNLTSQRLVRFAKAGGTPEARSVTVNTPVMGFLDINESSELTVDIGNGVKAVYPIRGDTLILPEKLARALWKEGIVLPNESQKNGGVMVRLADFELRIRLALSCFKSGSQIMSRFRTLSLISHENCGTH